MHTPLPQPIYYNNYISTNLVLYDIRIFLERKGSSSDERNMNEQETIKPIEEVQTDNKLSDFFKVCVWIYRYILRATF
jgi:hypothetical protein